MRTTWHFGETFIEHFDDAAHAWFGAGPGREAWFLSWTSGWRDGAYRVFITLKHGRQVPDVLEHSHPASQIDLLFLSSDYGDSQEAAVCIAETIKERIMENPASFDVRKYAVAEMAAMRAKEQS